MTEKKHRSMTVKICCPMTARKSQITMENPLTMNTPTFPTTRLRRRRTQENLRALVRETHLSSQQLIFPLFIKENLSEKKPIASMPGHYQWPLESLEKEIQELQSLGISTVILFGIPSHKDPEGRVGSSEEGIIQRAIPLIKKTAKEMMVITDVCLCEYTTTGHCGIVDRNQEIHNDATLNLLAEQAVSLAKAGSDIIAPSANMDGMVAALRGALDEADFQHLPILSYAIKYASSFYSPFREAAEGAPQFGDRKTYQMDPANAQEALLEAALDLEEGADFLMVKPAHTYLDVIHQIKTAYPWAPLGAYHVSGEYAMIKAASEKGWLDEKACFLETTLAMKRAGADFIITYAAKELAEWL